MTQFDVDGFVRRYRERADAVKERGVPPVAGEERRRFIEQAELDYLDYSLVGSSKWEIDDECLVLRIPLKK
ncbi:MAG: hypothetical protein OEM81_01415 [Acidimicrobiia bacterium]|nr:hypothetical protein [Acidimicrobiia bacterium]MDH3396469.1 hypothetical protein [Acidimicrobiia bacterium]